MTMYDAAVIRARLSGAPVLLAHAVAFGRWVLACPDRTVFFGCVVGILILLAFGGKPQ